MLAINYVWIKVLKKFAEFWGYVVEILGYYSEIEVMLLLAEVKCEYWSFATRFEVMMLNVWWNC